MHAGRWDALRNCVRRHHWLGGHVLHTSNSAASVVCCYRRQVASRVHSSSASAERPCHVFCSTCAGARASALPAPVCHGNWPSLVPDRIPLAQKVHGAIVPQGQRVLACRPCRPARKKPGFFYGLRAMLGTTLSYWLLSASNVLARPANYSITAVRDRSRSPAIAGGGDGVR